MHDNLPILNSRLAILHLQCKIGFRHVTYQVSRTGLEFFVTMFFGIIPLGLILTSGDCINFCGLITSAKVIVAG